MEREYEKLCSYFRDLIHDLWLRRHQIYWYYPQHIAEIYLSIYFLVKENRPLSSYETGIVVTQDQPCYFVFLKVLYGKS